MKKYTTHYNDICDIVNSSGDVILSENDIKAATINFLQNDMSIFKSTYFLSDFVKDLKYIKFKIFDTLNVDILSDEMLYGNSSIVIDYPDYVCKNGDIIKPIVKLGISVFGDYPCFRIGYNGLEFENLKTDGYIVHCNLACRVDCMKHFKELFVEWNSLSKAYREIVYKIRISDYYDYINLLEDKNPTITYGLKYDYHGINACDVFMVDLPEVNE